MAKKKAKTLDEWRKLVEKAFQKAENLNDQRLLGVKKSVIIANEHHLRKFGIDPEELLKDPPDPKDKPS